ncbi:MAG: hypothetical protein ACLP9L_07805 [Thermoguttaceae bacterium]
MNRFLFRLARRMADGFKPASAARAIVAAIIATAIAAAVASGFLTASGFRTAGLTPKGKSLSNQRTRAEEGESDQSYEIFFHVQFLLSNALVG